MSLFTETPIEAALWSFSVSLQEKLAEGVFQSPFFKGAVALYMGYVVAKGLVRMGSGRSNWVPVAGTLMCCLLGLTLLQANSTDAFRPESESGQAWATKVSVQNGGRYAGLQNDAHGLKFYTLIVGAMNGLSAQVSQVVAGVFGDATHAKSPKLLVNTLHEAARHTLDDPEVLATIDTLFESCAKTRTASAGVAYVSLSNQFDLK